jgi:plastocyanin
MTRIRALAAVVTLIAIAGFTAACGGGSAAAVTPPPDADASLDAKDNRFQESSLSLPAEESTLFFRNLDGAPHNVAIYRDNTAAESPYVGDVITDAATVYRVPALEPGSYFFRCDVHSEMQGALTVGGPS